jgi:VRR-NUC domain
VSDHPATLPPTPRRKPHSGQDKRSVLPLEKELERILAFEVRKAGGDAFKFVSPGRRGAPDRIVLLPGGRMCFVEMKRAGGRIRPDQKRFHSLLRTLGFSVQVLSSLAEIDDFIKEVKSYDAFGVNQIVGKGGSSMDTHAGKRRKGRAQRDKG